MPRSPPLPGRGARRRIRVMPETGIASPVSASPLTVLSEEERMFQTAAREFAENEIGPHVEEMDRDGVFRRDLLEKFFAQGYMGMHIPESFGGSGGSFFMTALAIEEFSRVDASAGVIVDVQNTLVANAL